MSFSWGNLRGDAGNSASVEVKLALPLRLNWKAKFPGPERAVAINGRLFVSCRDSLVACSLGDGSILWSQQGKKCEFEFSHVVANSDNLFFASEQSGYCALSQQKGEKIWQRKGPERLNSILIFVERKQLIISTYSFQADDGKLLAEFSPRSFRPARPRLSRSPLKVEAGN